MTTANDLITGAFSEIGISAAETPIEAFMIQDGLDQLNDMAAEWETSGLGLGLVPVENDTDTVRLERGYVAAVKLQLGLRLAPVYERPITQDQAAKASASWENVLRSLSIVTDVEFPSTLPLGSGNECPDITDRRFYPDNSKKNF